VVMIFVGGLVARGCGEAMGCHAGAGRSVNFVHVQYQLMSSLAAKPTCSTGLLGPMVEIA